MTCAKCDRQRLRTDRPWLVGKPCDICNGTGVTYLGDACRHCRDAKS